MSDDLVRKETQDLVKTFDETVKQYSGEEGTDDQLMVVSFLGAQILSLAHTINDIASVLTTVIAASAEKDAVIDALASRLERLEAAGVHH